ALRRANGLSLESQSHLRFARSLQLRLRGNNRPPHCPPALVALDECVDINSFLYETLAADFIVHLKSVAGDRECVPNIHRYFVLMIGVHSRLCAKILVTLYAGILAGCSSLKARMNHYDSVVEVFRGIVRAPIHPGIIDPS